MKKGFTFKSSSGKLRSAGLRDISRLFIPRTTTLRGDDVGVRAFTQNINHSRRPLSGIPALLTKQRDPRLQTSGMVSGFTLIELLVVVLIIGILASIALPQYQKAVKKAKFVQTKILAKSIANAQEIYYMANGEYAANLEDLDVQLPAPKNPAQTGERRDFNWGHCVTRRDTNEKSATCEREGMLYMIYYNHASASLAGKSVCVARNRDLNSVENQLCKAETGNTTYGTGTTGAYTWFYK